jgi:hypothetical protein
MVNVPSSDETLLPMEGCTNWAIAPKGKAKASKTNKKTLVFILILG